jgi:hypothetical protein
MGLFTATALYNYQPIVSTLADPFLKAWYDVGNPSSYTSGSTRLFDLSGTGNTLYISNSALTYNAVTGSLGFPQNANNYIGSNALTGLDVGFGSSSVEVWFRLNAAAQTAGSTYYWLFSNGDTSTNAASGAIRTFFGDGGFSNALTSQYGSSSVTTYTIPFGGTILYNKSNSRGVWRQMVLTKEFDTVKMYVDGALAYTKTGFASQSVFAPNKLIIGKVLDGSTFGPWYGDFSIYKQWNGKALTATEVSQSYEASRARFGK